MHANGTAELVRSQRQDGAAWNSLGTFTFSDTATQGVTILADPDHPIAADAVRFVPAAYHSLTAYYHVDHLGTPQKMTDDTRNIVWDATYDPFGVATIVQQPLYENPLRFPGQYYDAETGLHQNWMRDYDPELGRYYQPDPLGLWGGDLSLYGYAKQNSLRFTDPTGESAMAGALPLAGGAALADGPLPIGDLVALGILGGALIYDACTESAEEREKRCEANLKRDLATCRATAKRSGKSGYAICERQAYLRYSNCLSGRDNDIDAPLPPWGTK